jgi:hypothetical protein
VKTRRNRDDKSRHANASIREENRSTRQAQVDN